MHCLRGFTTYRSKDNVEIITSKRFIFHLSKIYSYSFRSYFLEICNILILGELFQVKRSIMLKMADACQDMSNKQTRFHEMYVQRHNNVR